MFDFFIPFATIGIAEFLDKSQIAVMFLAAHTRHHSKLLLGVMLAFIVVDGLAILAGSTITAVIPENIVKTIAALTFFVFGTLILLLRDKHKVMKEKIGKSVFISGFTLIFFAEWGDKTQIASAVFASRYQPVLTFLGIMCALFLLTVAAIYFGKILTKKINEHVLRKLAGIIFFILGAIFLFS